MKEFEGWDDFAYFAAIAREGGLQAAADALGSSPATLSRRMKAFEARLGKRLFLHGKQGYQLTGDGRALFEKTRAMEAGAADIARWQASSHGPVCVRISAGTWTALNLAQRLEQYWTPDAIWLPEFIHCDIDMDIARREIDIGIRNRRPEQPWLAGRKLGDTGYAAYARDASVTGWIGPTFDAALTPSGRWVLAEHGSEIVTKSNAPHLSCALAKAGIGRIVLPTFIGDSFPELQRVSDEIEELASEQWLVSHHETRHDPPIRAALDALARVLPSPSRQAT